ncbi:hypothetical protein [Anatilimnocola floriformis]|uniref:hypothetical protein n=1 Tax=Anatilimnocola floriformis TaxID=2948575 RepID=UPI0020C2C4CC|nr:hypothetical protein [Anatilimnocola floriformis]
MSGRHNKLIAALYALTCAVVTIAPTSAQVPARELTEEEKIEAQLVSASIAAQPPAARMPSLSTPRTPAATSRAAPAPAYNRLASAPEMFGDYFQSGGNVTYSPNELAGSADGAFGSFSIPSAGGSRHVKVGENNKALPADRFIFSYSHFHNALQYTETDFFGGGGTPVTQQFPIDRYTFGVEKTFGNGMWSVEVRMPFQGDFNFQGATVAGDGGQIGNLALILKHLLYMDDEMAIVAGMGIDTPTGSNFVLTDNVSFPTNQITFQNDALHLLPFLGVLLSNDGPYFINAFVQCDLATAGNRIQSGPAAGGPVDTLGLYNEQNLLFVDLGTGYWLYRDEMNDGFTSLAAILELHYTTSLQDTDEVAGDAAGRAFTYRNGFNRFDVLNMTVGLQAQYNILTSIRVACVVPMGAADDDRFFDSEVQVQINRRF